MNLLNILKKIIFLFFIQISILAFSSNIDTLKILLNNKTIKDKSGIYNRLSKQLVTSNLQQSQYFAIQAINAAKRYNNKKQLIEAYRNMGNIYYYYSQYNNAYTYYQLAYNISVEIKDSFNIMAAVNNIGAVYYAKNDYEKALDNYQTTLTIAKAINYNEGVSSALSNIGVIFQTFGRYQNALEYFKQVLAIDMESNNKNRISVTYSNIALALTNLQRYGEAQEYYNKAIKTFKEVNNIDGLVGALLGQAELLQQTNKLDLSLKVAYEALNIVGKTSFNEYLSQIYTIIGKVYALKNNISMAVDNYKKAFCYADTLKKINDKQRIALLFCELYSKAGNYKEAYQYSELARILNDSIFSKENTQLISEFEVRFEIEKKEKELLEKNLELEKKKNQITQQRTYIFFITGGLIFIIIGLISILIYLKIYEKRKRAGLEKQLGQYMLQALSKQMNPHFISNSLNSLQSFILKQDKRATNTFLVNFSRLMRIILDASQNTVIRLSDEIEGLKLYIQLELMRVSKPFNYYFTIDDSININKIGIPPLLIQPLVENAIWHGIVHKLDADYVGTVTISFNYYSEHKNELLCVVEDNGIGREKSLEINKKMNHLRISHATRITQKRIEIYNKLLNKNLKITYIDKKDSNGNSTGTRVEIILPITHIEA